MKKVSVIIPAYGVEQFISATVASVLQQTYTNIEVLIIDDGSPDRTGEICRSFTDPRVNVIRQENRGLAGARNTGIRHAQGDYLAFLDGDDLWVPEKLEKHINHLEESPDVGVSFSRSAFIDETGNPTGSYLMPKLTELTPLNLFCDNSVGNGSAPVIRREVFDAIRFQANLHGSMEDFFFDEELRRAEDVECWLRIVLTTAWKIEGIPEALTLYRINAGGLSASLLKQLESLEQVAKKVHAYAPDFIAKYGNVARAYHLRYLARSAVRLHDGAMAVKLMNQSLAAYWQIAVEQPRRTIMTLIAAYLLWLLPRSLYQPVFSLANKPFEARQRQRILRDQAEQSV